MVIAKVQIIIRIPKSFDYLLPPGQEGLEQINEADKDTSLERSQQVGRAKT